MVILKLSWFSLLYSQQAGGTIGMDADATASLHKKGIKATDDSFKFTWFQVCLLEGFLFGLNILDYTPSPTNFVNLNVTLATPLQIKLGSPYLYQTLFLQTRAPS